MPPESRNLVGYWLSSAASHLRVAGVANDLVPPEWAQVIYHAQQAVERALKALHVFHGMDIRRIHNLAKLRSSLIHGGHDAPIGLNDAQWLTDMFVMHRYAEPDPRAEPLTADDIQRALAIAQQTLCAAQTVADAAG